MTKRPPRMELLDRFVGAWTTEATHPAMPGVVVKGTATVEWLEGERFLIQRSRNEHPDFPDSIAIIGDTTCDRVEDGASSVAPDPATDAPLAMHYFDSRGVFRAYQVSAADRTLRIWRDAPDLTQRYAGTFSEDGDTLDGGWQACTDGVWTDDLTITYRRVRG